MGSSAATPLSFLPRSLLLFPSYQDGEGGSGSHFYSAQKSSGGRCAIQLTATGENLGRVLLSSRAEHGHGAMAQGRRNQRIGRISTGEDSDPRAAASEIEQSRAEGEE